MRLGFIGTGAIAEAMIEGLCGVGGFTGEIAVSERSAERSARLAGRHANVRVESDNQALVDACDWVVLAVLPDQAVDVASDLKFRADHKILAVVAGLTQADLAPAVAPATDIHRAIPMPPIERGLGPIPVFPPDAELEALFATVGTPVPVADERQIQAFFAVSGLMAAFFETVASTATWLEGEDVPPREAALYASAMFHALAALAADADAEGLQGLAPECLTEGGLNDQVLRELREAGWFDALKGRLDRLMTRLDGA